MDKPSMTFRIRNRVEEEQKDNKGNEPLEQEEFREKISDTKEDVNTTPSDSGVKEILLNAPVGHAYTEALKHLLNKRDNKTGVIRTEGSMTQLVATGTITEGPETIEDIGASMSKAYVFVYDGRRMNLGQVEEMVHKLAKVKQDNPNAGYVALSIEGMEEVLEKADTTASVMSQELLHLEQHHGVEVFYSRTKTMSRIESFLGL